MLILVYGCLSSAGQDQKEKEIIHCYSLSLFAAKKWSPAQRSDNTRDHLCKFSLTSLLWLKKIIQERTLKILKIFEIVCILELFSGATSPQMNVFTVADTPI